MPNWFYGNIQIEGDAESMKDIIDWAKSYMDKEFNDLVPLPCGEYDRDVACKYWGNKWGICSVTTDVEIVDDVYVAFDYDSPWSMPRGLFYQLEKKFNVVVTSQGHSGDYVEFYEDGKYNDTDATMEKFKKWHRECNASEELPSDDDEWLDFYHKHEMDFIGTLFDEVKKDCKVFEPDSK